MPETFEQIAHDMDYKAPPLGFLFQLADRKTEAVVLALAEAGFRRLCGPELPDGWVLAKSKTTDYRWGNGCLCHRVAYDVLRRDGTLYRRGWYCEDHDDLFWDVASRDAGQCKG